MRYFHELDTDEQDKATQIVFETIKDDYETRKLELIDIPREDFDNLIGHKNLIEDTLWELASSVVQDAVFIPDDGAMVVRL